MKDNVPQVFMSHATEDKERFVLRFAERLTAKGIYVWLDTWEMLPGDKLVDKIFNCGLQPSDAVILVLSNFSISKPWVQKELNTSVVKSIEDKTKLIPIRLDGAHVPECLRDTYFQTINDTENYGREFDRIVSAIYGRYDKPPLGPAPAYTDPKILRLDGLCRSDSLFLEEACRVALEQGHPTILNREEFQARLVEGGMSNGDISDAQEVLAARHLIKLSGGPGPLSIFTVEVEGFRLFAEGGGVDHYDKKIKDVARFLVERADVGRVVSNVSVETELGLPSMLVEHIFERLRNQGYVEYAESIGGRLFMDVFKVSPELRRNLLLIDDSG